MLVILRLGAHQASLTEWSGALLDRTDRRTFQVFFMACRDLMIKVQTQVRPTGACFYGAAMVSAALDAFASFLTGQRYYLAALEDRGLIVPQPVDSEEVFGQPLLPAPEESSEPS